jgi:hypothetical protein
MFFFSISKIKWFYFVKFMAPKKGMTTNFFSPCISLLVLDPGSGMGKNQDPGSGINIPDPQHWKVPLKNISSR